MRASEETPEQRLVRWCKLRGHLRAVGLNKKPDDTLPTPDAAARTGVHGRTLMRS